MDDDPGDHAGSRGREWIVIDRHKLRRGGSGSGRRRISRLRDRPDRKRIMVDRNQIGRRIVERVMIYRDEINHDRPPSRYCPGRLEPAAWC
jgi:hypothetical protein